MIFEPDGRIIRNGDNTPLPKHDPQPPRRSRRQEARTPTAVPKSPNVEKIAPPAIPTATRYSTNHNWNRRGDNTKYREDK